MTIHEITPTNKGQSAIKMMVNTEEDVVDHLSKEHTANMSLLFYDFNNTTERRQRRHNAHNFTNMVIPEENEEHTGNFPAIKNNLKETCLKMPCIQNDKSRQSHQWNDSLADSFSNSEFAKVN